MVYGGFTYGGFTYRYILRISVIIIIMLRLMISSFMRIIAMEMLNANFDGLVMMMMMMMMMTMMVMIMMVMMIVMVRMMVVMMIKGDSVFVRSSQLSSPNPF